MRQRLIDLLWRVFDRWLWTERAGFPELTPLGERLCRWEYSGDVRRLEQQCEDGDVPW